MPDHETLILISKVNRTAKAQMSLHKQALSQVWSSGIHCNTAFAIIEVDGYSDQN